jgi:hypothetical protein
MFKDQQKVEPAGALSMAEAPRSRRARPPAAAVPLLADATLGFVA